MAVTNMKRIDQKFFIALLAVWICPDASVAEDANASRSVVVDTPGLVAFWDFVQREPDGGGRFTAVVPPGSPTDYPLDAANYVKDYWGTGREATYADFPQLGRGPFGNAIRIVKETDPDFRPFLYIPRSRLHDTPLDIKGDGKSVTVVVWAIRESGNHALAGIWHEGTDLKQKSTASIAKVERGQRQYALFAGLNKQGSACGHVSENGASSFRNKYALHKCNSAGQSPAVPADSPAEKLDASWQCFAMTFDDEKDELTGWLNGVSGDRWLENPKKDGLISYAYKAYMQGHFAKLPGKQAGEDPSFPKDQYYNPPEGEPLSVKVIRESDGQRVELREHRFTKIEVTLEDGKEVARDLVALRLNPWWYPHGIYTPKDDQSGGPFTIGRVIHSSRSVGFTGWIGGVAVFDRALSEKELQTLAALR
ncbi:LamG domain-containing protein [Rosistilla oblonga]|uniref:LamG domain-containing protein n=1 Tax=Rosistilla oblonga TaxID=2527990 RepID=UPI001E301EF4|nr:LamG domain-containing protein [Rosistilla oblonga]